jgi:hypothetical protein
MALSCHCRIEFRKNPAREENSYPSMYLKGEKRETTGTASDQPKVSLFLFLSLCLSLSLFPPLL